MMTVTLVSMDDEEKKQQTCTLCMMTLTMVRMDVEKKNNLPLLFRPSPPTQLLSHQAWTEV